MMGEALNRTLLLERQMKKSPHTFKDFAFDAFTQGPGFTIEKIISDPRAVIGTGLGFAVPPLSTAKTGLTGLIKKGVNTLKGTVTSTTVREGLKKKDEIQKSEFRRQDKK